MNGYATWGVTRARYDLPPDQIERHVAGFIAEVSRPK
jgi:hypothetical protein